MMNEYVRDKKDDNVSKKIRPLIFTSFTTEKLNLEKLNSNLVKLKEDNNKTRVNDTSPNSDIIRFFLN